MKQNSEQMRINKRSYHGNGFEGADLRDFLNGEQDSDHGVLHETEHITPADVPEKHGGPGADDALGLYLKQMGAIALLSRDKEIAVASRLEILRGAIAMPRSPTGASSLMWSRLSSAYRLVEHPWTEPSMWCPVWA